MIILYIYNNYKNNKMSKKLSFELVAVRAKNDKINTIKNINLWGLELDDVSIFKNMPNLEIISLSINNLKTLRDFKDLKNLKELYLRKNNISDIKEIKFLSNCNQLKILSLNENPISNNPNYRLNVIKYLPFLDKLDDKIITQSEREMAFQMTGNDLLNSNTFQNNLNNMMVSNDFSRNSNYNNNYYNNNNNFNQPIMSNTFSNYDFRNSNSNFNINDNLNHDNYISQNYYSSNNNFNSNNNFYSSIKQDKYDNNVFNNENKDIMDCIIILLNKLNNNELGYVRNVINQKIQK